jgi:NAD(P)-dependent dehydrogenase (short-subunit alcohol dehydrogenase family)
LADTGVTVNALLPGGATDTGMVPSDIAPRLRQQLLHPDIMIPPLLWLVSDTANEVTGSRLTANLWDATLPPGQAAEKSRAKASWIPQTF